MARKTVPLDQDTLLDRLERLEQQLAQVAKARGGGFGTTLRGFALGALVGGGLALLYAPQRGEETRQRVLQLTEQAKEQATQVVGQAQQVASQRKDQGQSSPAQSPSNVPIGSSQWRQPPASPEPQG